MSEVKEYLPIGSVVLLKDAQKKVMITGYTPIDMETKNKIYEYLGGVFPEGIIKSDENILFDTKDIDKIFFKGFVNEEQENFITEVKEILENEEKKKQILNEIK